MSVASTRKPKTKNPFDELFVGIPHSVMTSGAFISLSPRAKALLLELAFQFRGRNNGNLTAAPSVLEKRGWKSRSALQKALAELLDADLIWEARKGSKPRKCSLYAVTWRLFDYDPSRHDAGPRAFPYKGYLLKNANRYPPLVIRPPKQDCGRTSNSQPMSAGGVVVAMNETG